MFWFFHCESMIPRIYFNFYYPIFNFIFVFIFISTSIIIFIFIFSIFRFYFGLDLHRTEDIQSSLSSSLPSPSSTSLSLSPPLYCIKIYWLLIRANSFLQLLSYPIVYPSFHSSPPTIPLPPISPAPLYTSPEHWITTQINWKVRNLLFFRRVEKYGICCVSVKLDNRFSFFS